MATVNLGRVGFVNKGTYSGSTSYKVNDVVDYNSGVYTCIQAHSGQLPTVTAYWQNWVANDKALDSAVVHKTGDETIAGVKNFSSSPIVPNATTGSQAVNKSQLDLKVSQDSATGSAMMPAGTTAQRPISPSNGYMRYNTDLSSMEAYSNGAWGSVGGGATGGGTDHIFYENGQVITTDYTIPVGKNAMSAGNITINTGVTVTVSSGSKWSIV